MDNLEEKDLTGDDEGIASAKITSAPPEIKKYNLEEAQEKVRGVIAQGLIVMLAIIILFAFMSLWHYSSSFADLEKLMTIIFGPVIALVGSAIGLTSANGDGVPGGTRQSLPHF